MYNLKHFGNIMQIQRKRKCIKFIIKLKHLKERAKQFKSLWLHTI